MMLRILDKNCRLIFLAILGCLFSFPLLGFAQTYGTSERDLVQFLVPSTDMVVKVGEPLLIQYKTIESADIGEVRHSVSGAFGGDSFSAFLGKPGLNSFVWTPTSPGRYRVAVSVYQRQTHSTQWSDYITVNSSDTAPIVDFSTSQVLFTKKSKQGVLTWRATNATSCSLITGLSKKKKVPLVGSQKIKPKDNTQYTIECINGTDSGDGTHIARKTIEVSVWHSTARLIDSFSIRNFTGIPNTTALFTWKAPKASSCNLYRVAEGGSLAGVTQSSGFGSQDSVTAVVTPGVSTYPTQYALLCESSTGVGEQAKRLEDIRVLTVKFAK